MAKSFRPFYALAVRSKTRAIVNSDSTNYVDVLTGGAEGTDLNSIFLSSTDTSARTVTLAILANGATIPQPFYTVSVPANAGNIVNVNVIDVIRAIASSAVVFPGAYDSNANRFMVLESGDKLQAKVGSAVTNTAGFAVHVRASGKDY